MGDADVRLRVVDHDEIQRSWSGAGAGRVWQTMFPGSCEVCVDRGLAADHRFRFGDTAEFHIDATARNVLCAPRRLRDPEWQRFALDTLLWWCSLIRGHRLLHASAVETDGGVIAIGAGSGAGKSTLAAAMIARGARFFSDDVVAMTGLIAHPGPPLMNVATAGLSHDPPGVPLAHLADSDELWLLVDGPSPPSASLSAIVLLDRTPGQHLDVLPVSVTVLDLMPHVWVLPGRPDAPAELFHWLSDLALAVPVVRLTADPAIHPNTLAATLAAALQTHREGSIEAR